MSYFLSAPFSRVLLLTTITILHLQWQQRTNTVVPQPYLDEAFHIPQAQAYWAGDWDYWDPKITTPPGLYVWSWGVNCLRSMFSSPSSSTDKGESKGEFKVGIEQLRFSNAVVLYVLLVSLYIWTSVSRRAVHHEAVLQREFNIVMFPLLFFFSGLYYTDLFSVLTVVVTMICWSAGSQLPQRAGGMKVVYQVLHWLFGLVALGTRQTNVFWVAVYLGGLQVVESVKRLVGLDRIHDPPIAEAFFEDFPIACISIAQHGISILPRLILDLWPSLALLATFAAFIVWNGGVVLGDRSNHIATPHLPQLLYLCTVLIFFSWPVLLPLLTKPQLLRSRIPRPTTLAIFSLLAVMMIHFSTLIHPFLLADNRHYTFYVIRLLLLRHWSIRYLVVPIYVVCGYLAICILGGTTPPRRGSVVAVSRGLVGPDTVHVSFVLVWLIATSLSLVTAPLVEPRYFIVPWLVWRMHVPEVFPSSSIHPRQSPPTPPVQSGIDAPASTAVSESTNSTKTNQNSKMNSRIGAVLTLLSHYSLTIEFLWYALINLATCYLFLYRPFSWPQEPGENQRFMW